jgi:hypothetical protein
MEMETTLRQPKRITYSESRTINIGDYESIKCELRYSTEVEEINEKESTISIWAHDTVTFKGDQDAFKKSCQRAMTRVRKILDHREADIRIRTSRFTEHDTGKKGLLQGLLDAKNWFKKQDKFKVEADEIEEYEDGNIYIDEDN